MRYAYSVCPLKWDATVNRAVACPESEADAYEVSCRKVGSPETVVLYTFTSRDRARNYVAILSDATRKECFFIWVYRTIALAIGAVVAYVVMP